MIHVIQLWGAFLLLAAFVFVFSVLAVVALCMRHYWRDPDFRRGIFRAWSLKLW